MIGRGERALLVLTPAVAMAAVGLGLRIGAPSDRRAAVVWGAPVSRAGTGLAWQVQTFDEVRGTREAVAIAEVDVTARSGGHDVRWVGKTNDDGTAEMLLAAPSPLGLHLDVRAGPTLLASGDALPPPSFSQSPRPAAWARFARRDGPVLLDVAFLGQRVASGFPATIWVRATDAANLVALASARIEADAQPGLALEANDPATDSRGWARLVATPTGYGVPLTLHARALDGRSGLWSGALFVSPGAAQIVTRDRYAVGEEPIFDVVVPSMREFAYVEIDDRWGRVWGGALSLATPAREMPRGIARPPRLSPGLYWAVASGDPGGAAQLGPGTIVRPFFVAESDEAAIASAPDDECSVPRDPREMSRALGVCLALAAVSPVPRWKVLDGFAAQRSSDERNRGAGLAVAVGAILVAMVLEATLLGRVAQTARARLRALAPDPSDGTEVGAKPRAGRFAIPLLVALLGFALLVAFLLRLA